MLLLSGALLTSPCYAATETPYVPVRDDIILQTVPTVADPRVRAFEALRDYLARDPGDMQRAVALAKAYVDYGRATGDARYLGRAEAVIAPWLARTPTSIPVGLVQATILQSRHFFGEARAQLQAIVQREGDNAQAWLTLATVAQVQGDMTGARHACAHLLDASDPLIPAGCLSSLNAVDGHAETAYRTLMQLWPQAKAEPVDVQSWLQGILADTARYMGDAAAADDHFRTALQLTPGDNFLLADYGDFLLEQGRAQDALQLVRNDAQSDTSFLRQVYAESALGLPQASSDAEEMRRRFAALELRGTRTYMREQAGFELRIGHDPRRALALAVENWSMQRAPEDMRILLESALAAAQPQAAQPALAQLDAMHLQYPVVLALAGQVRTRRKAGTMP